MNLARWHQIESMYNKALEMEESRRVEFLREACAGDDELRHDVERLLAARPAAASFLEQPALKEIAHEFAATAVASWIGRQIGNYQFVSLVGAGGMGEVYRAHDTKLKREVAIKILPDEFSRDPDRVGRIEREAQLLASLNHPNIAAIYDLKEADGLLFLILELIEGETIAERLKRGPIPLDDALEIATQVAEGLAVAHDRGIIHRDLKPANIKLTPEGKVKVLDFGLAKAFASDASDVHLSNSPASMPGMILGTAAYMSPEQANGALLDRRTDIFAFGAVLYEMLTGKRAFPGDTAGDILASVIRAEPDWTELPTNTPTGIRRLLRRCLAKDRNRRLGTVRDARIEIDEVQNEPQINTPAVSSRSRTREWIKWTAPAVVTLIAVVAIWSFRPIPSPGPEMRVDIITPPTMDPISLAISPDGQKIVVVATFEGRSRLWLRNLNSVAQELTGTDNASYPFWSPDSLSVGFFAEGKLKRIDIDGGLVQTLADAIARGGTWSPNGVILFAPTTAGQLARVPASGGSVTLTASDAQRSAGTFPYFLPGGRQFLFYKPLGSEDKRGIYLGSLESPATKRLIAADTAGVYLPPGWLLFIRHGALMAQSFDPSHEELRGDPVTVADRVGFDSSIRIGAFSVSATGQVMYRAGGGDRRQLTWFDRSGKVLGTLGAPDENDLIAPELSPDDHQVMTQRTVQGNTDIWLLDGVRTIRFTSDADIDRLPIWSPDKTRIVFASSRKGVRNLYLKHLSGSDREEPLVESLMDKAPNSWSHDGNFLLYTVLDPKSGADLWVLPFGQDRKPFIFLSTRFDERASQFSPDGKWVAYQSNESGPFQIYVRPFPGPGRASQVSTSGGIQTRWRPDGKELYYIAPDGKLMAVPVTPKNGTLEAGTPVALFQTRIWGGGTNAFNRQQYDVARDGRFLISVALDPANTPLTLLLNWKPPVK